MVIVAKNAPDGQPAYFTSYVFCALNDDELQAPDKERANGDYETLISLYNAWQVGGNQAARSAWETIKKFRPALAEFDPDNPISSYKPDDDMIANELVKDIGEDAAYFYNQWRIYTNGWWQLQDDAQFRRYVRKALCSFRSRGIAVNQNRIRSLASMLADDLFVRDQEIMERQKEQAKYVNLRNGLFNLETMTLEPHRRDLYFTNQLNFDYDPKASVRSFRRYLNTSLVDPEDKTRTDESLIDLVLEILGYCMTARTDLKASFWLYGGKDTGKSTLVTLLKGMLGDLYETIDLTQLGTNKFLLAGMVGKRVVGFAEGESNTVLPDAIYKTLTGGSDEIFADVKNKTPITFRMQAKIVWAMNNLPRISDRTGATTRRVHIVPFNRTIPESERISNLESLLLQERPGIFNLVMDHLQELTERGSFAHCKQSERIKQEYVYQNDTEGTFINEMCAVHPDSQIRGSELHDAYKLWCERFGFHPKNMNQVAQDWRRLGFIQKTSNGSWWQGLSLKPMV